MSPLASANSAVVPLICAIGVSFVLEQTFRGMFGASVKSYPDLHWQNAAWQVFGFTVPKIDLQVGASYQSIPGIEYSAVYAAPNSDVSRPVAQGGLGRLPAGAVATGTTSLNLIAPGTTYGPRFNQIDLRLGKVIRFANRRAVASLDLFNILNDDTISGASATYATWLAPTSVVAPLARLTR